jgi:hypothetical protein
LEFLVLAFGFVGVCDWVELCLGACAWAVVVAAAGFGFVGVDDVLLQAVAFWALRGDYDPVWWAPNLFLLFYPVLFLPVVLRGARVERYV